MLGATLSNFAAGFEQVVEKPIWKTADSGPVAQPDWWIPEGTPALLENDHSVGSEFAPRT